jgi:hypothetical protein
MGITVSVTRDGTDIGELEFVAIPREGEVVQLDGVEGEVERVEHVVASDKPPEARIFIDGGP